KWGGVDTEECGGVNSTSNSFEHAVLKQTTPDRTPTNLQSGQQIVYTNISVSLVVNEVSYPILKLNVDSSAKQRYKAPPRHPTTSKVSLVVLHPVNVTVPFVSNLNVLFRITQISLRSFSIQYQYVKLVCSIVNDPLSQVSIKIVGPPPLFISLVDYIFLNEVEFIVMLMDV
ncbi:MAG: hypothetical protein EZS28_033724, partial [Streblomastix strix]